MADRVKFRFPAIRPLVPPSSAWVPYLKLSYAQHWFSNFGPVVRQFEAELTARFCHANEVITCANNATSGIAAALIALDVRGTVAIPAYTFPATASAVLMAGAEPAVIDVDSTTWTLSLNILERFVSSDKVAAVVLVSPFGLRQDFSPHLQFCTERGLPVLIDSAAGLNMLASPLLDESCFEIYSLHATKAFPVGEGGVIRSRGDQAPALRRALNFGLEAGRPVPSCWGINGKLPEISAAVGLAVLKEFDAVIGHRKAAAARYINLLQEYDGLIFPTDVDRSPWQVFPLLLPRRSSAEIFMQRAAAESLQIRWSYKPTLENWPRTRSISACPNAETLSERTVTLPIYSDMTEDEHNAILEIMRRSLDHALLA